MTVKSQFTAILFTLFASASASAHPSQFMSGMLTVNDGVTLSAAFADGSIGVLHNGEVSLKFNNANIFSGWTGSRQIDIVQNGKNASLFLEADTFQSFSNFTTQTTYDNGQNFEMIGRESDVNVHVGYKTAPVGCTTAGVCTQCAFKSADGLIKHVCTYGVNDNCSGLQDVYGKLTTTSITPVVSIVAKSSAAEVAKIIGTPTEHSQFTAIRPVSECKVDQ